MKGITPVLTVTDLTRSLEWYEKVLGFEPVFVNRHEEDDAASAFYAVLNAGSCMLHLGRDTEMEQVAGNSGFEVSTDRFDAVHKTAVESGVDFYFDITLNPAGDENFALNDPDGNRIIVVRD